jgi:hypothetical protein
MSPGHPVAFVPAERLRVPRRGRRSCLLAEWLLVTRRGRRSRKPVGRAPAERHRMAAAVRACVCTRTRCAVPDLIQPM